MQLDRYDRQILELLQQDGRISNQDLADRISLSPSSCLRRDEGEPQQRDFACKVRFTEGKPTPDVISFTFLWQAEGG